MQQRVLALSASIALLGACDTETKVPTDQATASEADGASDGSTNDPGTVQDAGTVGPGTVDPGTTAEPMESAPATQPMDDDSVTQPATEPTDSATDSFDGTTTAPWAVDAATVELGCDWAAADPAFAAGVQKELGLGPDAIPTQQQLDSVTATSSNGAASLAGVDCLAQLRSLALHSSTISDLTPLISKKQLRGLEIESAELEDVSPLAASLELVGVMLRGTRVTDLSALSHLPKLETVSILDGAAPALDPLCCIATLATVRLEGVPISDLEPLLGANALRSLSVERTQLSDLAPLVAWEHSSMTLHVADNPLNPASLEEHIPALLEAGWCVEWTVEGELQREPASCFGGR